MRNLEALSCAISPRAGGQSVGQAASIPFVIHNTRDDSTWNGNYYGQALSPMCLLSVIPDITAHDQISQVSPLCICNVQVIKDWRWEWPWNEAIRICTLQCYDEWKSDTLLDSLYSYAYKVQMLCRLSQKKHTSNSSLLLVSAFCSMRYFTTS